MPPELPWNGPPVPNIIISALLGYLRAGLLLLLLPESEQTDTGDLDDLETDTGNITLGLALTTETGEEDLVVLVNEVQTTIVGDWWVRVRIACPVVCALDPASFTYRKR